MVKAVDRMSARERARQGRARLLKEREEHDRKVDAATLQYFSAAEVAENAAAALSLAEEESLSALAALLELGLTGAQIVTLTDVDESVVRQARRLRKGRADEQVLPLDEPPAE